MSATIPNLWPPGISVDVVLPRIILKTQADELTRLTKGLLEGDITTTSSDKGVIIHNFDVVARALKGSRHRILTAEHSKEMVYPVRIWADCYEDEAKENNKSLKIKSMLAGSFGDPPRKAEIESESQLNPYRDAASESELTSHISQILRSKQVLGLVNSLLARINNQNSQPNPETDSTGQKDQ